MSDDKNHPARGDLLRRAGVVQFAGIAGTHTLSGATPTRNAASLGARLQGVQHVGLTVQNMDRAFTFYTEVLGGTEVMRDGDFHGERIHNTLLTTQEIEARERNVNPRTLGIPDLRGGAQRLDVRFIQFDNVAIELLQYRDAMQPAGGGAAFAEPLEHMSPAFPRMMHICFHIRDDVDFNTFIADLEAESARRGMSQVRANRVVTVTTEAERKATPLAANSNPITDGKSNGWRLIYCTGSEGEQLEFVQALGPVKRVFDRARDARRGPAPSPHTNERNMTMKALSAMFALALGACATTQSPSPMTHTPGDSMNIVLVHGAWADGSGWQGVHDILAARGYNVSIVQNPLTSLADDVAATKRVLDRQDGPTVLVGHSYGGAVITVAGDAPNVAALVYVSAFVPDVGESIAKLTEGGENPPLKPSADGFLFFDPQIFPQAFAQDLSPEQGAFLAASQVPPAGIAFGTPITRAAWKTKPTSYVLSTDDRIIPPAAQRRMAQRANASITEVRASHAVYISQPEAVADAVEQAAQRVATR